MAFLRSSLLALVLLIALVGSVNGASFSMRKIKSTNCSDDTLQTFKKACFDSFVNYAKSGGYNLIDGIKKRVNDDQFCNKLASLKSCISNKGNPCPEIVSKAKLFGYADAKQSEYMAVASALASEDYRCNDGQELLDDNQDCIKKIAQSVVEAKCQNQMKDFMKGTCQMEKVYVDCLTESFAAKCGNDGEKYACKYYTKGILAVNQRCVDELPECDNLASDDDAEEEEEKSAAVALGFGLLTFIAAVLRI
uniref:DUF19 domain-containing protein n=1 Tax=Panagrellus redivivus TaxID=6233 RepID=A0A7E4VHB9_PANRE